ncbi:hypothetical protein [Bacteroidetes bacterium endosymbiont of Geopemphigus sp.]|uniref:hypothetical protein n=1 Tax=Bacteroidetes bacterium endosymbiont of Geopemphigus sp. TaxID=2047937 RepID=UPI0018A867BE|nr:hypothetical protein [Bacteroidetes bacterium endosymbiont of Geopemphigus sp.]
MEKYARRKFLKNSQEFNHSGNKKKDYQREFIRNLIELKTFLFTSRVPAYAY